mgnify:CR=1 FL=1
MSVKSVMGLLLLIAPVVWLSACAESGIDSQVSKNTQDMELLEVYKSPTCGCCGKWIDHLNKADSLFVNASTWGLLLAGKIVKTPKLSGDVFEIVSKALG